MDKPEKKVYEPDMQKRIYRLMEDKLQEIFDSDERIEEIKIYGSAQNMQFGDYVETFKPGTPTARDKTDIDAIFLVKGLKGKEITLKSGYHLQDSRFITDDKGNTVYVEGHPVMCANLTTPENYNENLDKPWPVGFDFTKDSKQMYKR